jgi:hypothetical protein
MRNGKLIDQFGNQQWFKDNKLHREDGPAVILPSIREWWINGRRHRVDGPAVIAYNNGYKEWWLNGFQLKREKWWEMLSDEWKVKALFNGEGL